MPVDGCGQPCHGIGCQQNGKISLGMTHSWRRCNIRPQSVSAPQVGAGIRRTVLSCVTSDDGWRTAVIDAMSNEGPELDHSRDIRRIEAAITNLQKQLISDVISDQEFRSKFQVLQRQLRALAPKPQARPAPDLDRAAELLKKLSTLCEHPELAQTQRRELAREGFDEI